MTDGGRNRRGRFWRELLCKSFLSRRSRLLCRAPIANLQNPDPTARPPSLQGCCAFRDSPSRSWPCIAEKLSSTL